MKLGRHMPVASKPVEALKLAREIGCDCVQIFVTNPRAWQVPGASPALESAFREAAQHFGLHPVVVHATYLINLASQREDIVEHSVTLLRATLERAARYHAASVVFHIGSHGGAGEDVGTDRLICGIRRVLDGSPEDIRLLLENDTGGGGKLGYRMENLATVLDALPDTAHRLGVCLDTAHLWGAGFDIGTSAGAETVLAHVDTTLGLHRVHVLHVNDTPKALGSHLDHHARLGEGLIGQEGLRTILRAPALSHVAAVLETPLCESKPDHIDWAAERNHIVRVRKLAGLRMPRRIHAQL